MLFSFFSGENGVIDAATFESYVMTYCQLPVSWSFSLAPRWTDPQIYAV